MHCKGIVTQDYNLPRIRARWSLRATPVAQGGVGRHLVCEC